MRDGAAAAAVEPDGFRRGDPGFRRASIALFLAGFSTFSLLYCVQPLLPELARHFRVTPAAASLALSLTTGGLAGAIMLAGAASEAMSRRTLMFGSMALAAAFNLLAAAAPDWTVLLLARLGEGVALGGVPAVAMAYLAEETHPQHLAAAMGLYVSGTAFGGMMGRVGMGLLSEVMAWRGGMAVLGGLDLLAALGFVALLPRSRRFSPRRPSPPRAHLAIWGAQLGDPVLRRLFGIGFVLTSVFVALFNYAGFRLALPPYRLGPAAIGAVFLVYGFGMVGSALAGGLAGRIGRRAVLLAGLGTMGGGCALTLLRPLPLVVAGIAAVTFGFFVAHAVASGWIGRVAGARKGHAASLYLLSYYLGSSVTGSATGWAWQEGGWGAVAGVCGGLAALGMVLAAPLREPAA